MAEELTTGEQLKKMGSIFAAEFITAAADRVTLEAQWLKNLRQDRGLYDPDVEAKIPADKSHVYPRDTRTKGKGFVAKMMELMFPAQELNFSVKPKRFPDIAQEDLQNILDTLRNQKAQMMQQQMMEQSQQTGQPPTQTNPQEIELDPHEIELAVRLFAEERAQEMENECKDQLEACDWVSMSRNVVRSGWRYGIGIAEGPIARIETDRTWEKNEEGSYSPVVRELAKPEFKNRSIWDFYFDLAAKKWEDQEKIFIRMVMNRNALYKLTKKTGLGYYPETIIAFLKENPSGNYVAKSYENEYNTVTKTENIMKRDTRRYEVIRRYGYVDGHMLNQAGINVSEDRIHEDVLADVWLLNGEVIRAIVAPFGNSIADMFHVFMYADDDDAGLCGVGGPEELRDSQMKRCANDRILFDNMASIGGPITVLNKALIMPGQELKNITAFTTIYRDDDNPITARLPALEDFHSTSHIPELLSVREAVKKDIDEESCLPGFSMGQPQNLGEAFRTSNNMSMMMGGANSIPKDVVRSFDRFIKSIGTSLLMWNMDSDLNPKKEIKGDYDLFPKGTMSLVAKEVRGQALDQFWMTLEPADKAMFDRYGTMQDRMTARDLSLDRLKPREQAEKAYQQVLDAQAQAQQIESGLTQAKTMKTQADAGKSQVQAQDIAKGGEINILEAIAKIKALLANTKTAADKQRLEETKVLLEQLAGGENENGSTGAGANSSNTASKQSGIRKNKKSNGVTAK